MIAHPTKQQGTHLRLVSTIYYLGGGMRDHTKGFGEAHCPACTVFAFAFALSFFGGVATFPFYLPLTTYHIPLTTCHFPLTVFHLPAASGQSASGCRSGDKALGRAASAIGACHLALGVSSLEGCKTSGRH